MVYSRHSSIAERLTSSGPKRILSLDGGGVRGLITVCFLERIEKYLRQKHQNDDLRLSDYFDLIGGTSAGSILAAALTTGMETSEVKQLAIECSNRIFSSRRWQRWESVFNPGPLKAVLEEVFGDIRLGGSEVRSGLVVVTKRADTHSTWPLHNNPAGKYYQQNKDMLLRDVLYASAAAPLYFMPERVHVGAGEIGAFVDGGVSMSNNPAMLMFLMATLSGFRFQWQTGKDHLLICSVGTGRWRDKQTADQAAAYKIWDWAARIPHMLISDANFYNQLLLQSFSKTVTPWAVDTEIGDLSDEAITSQPLFTYLRYDAPLDEDGLRAMNMNKLIPKLMRLRQLSSAQCRDDLLQIGAASARTQVDPEHFPDQFDVA